MCIPQVLQALQAAAADSLEDCILECPAGLQALVEVLRDPREEVRNEVILLLGQVRLRTTSACMRVYWQNTRTFFCFPCCVVLRCTLSSTTALLVFHVLCKVAHLHIFFRLFCV